MTPFAHAGHWLAQLLYIVPVAGLLIAVGISKWRERRGTKSGER